MMWAWTCGFDDDDKIWLAAKLNSAANVRLRMLPNSGRECCQNPAEKVVLEISLFWALKTRAFCAQSLVGTTGAYFTVECPTSSLLIVESSRSSVASVLLRFNPHENPSKVRFWVLVSELSSLLLVRPFVMPRVCCPFCQHRSLQAAKVAAKI